MTKPRKPDSPAQAVPVQQQRRRQEHRLPAGVTAVNRARQRARQTHTGSSQNPEPSLKQEEIWQQAVAFCAWNLPTLWTAGEPGQETDQRWLVPIVLRYLDGYEGNLGEMVFNEPRQEFTVLTDKATLAERAHCSCFPTAPAFVRGHSQNNSAV